MVHRVVWRVGSGATLDFWATRLEAEGIETTRSDDDDDGGGGGVGWLRFADLEGLSHELVVSDSEDPVLIAEHPEVPAEHALQGFEGVRAYSFDPAGSAAMLEQLMGASRVGDEDRWELRGSRRGGWIAFDPAPPARGRQSAGVVHHVAFGTTQTEHPRWQQHLAGAGVPVTPVIDRHYFHSIYFREPNGVLYEIADDGPGFAVDVPEEQFGAQVILPPKFEPDRERIEQALTPLPDPRASAR